jgi:hypothetical protein
MDVPGWPWQAEPAVASGLVLASVMPLRASVIGESPFFGWTSPLPAGVSHRGPLGECEADLDEHPPGAVPG